MSSMEDQQDPNAMDNVVEERAADGWKAIVDLGTFKALYSCLLPLAHCANMEAGYLYFARAETALCKSRIPDWAHGRVSQEPELSLSTKIIKFFKVQGR